jgi:phosphoesterase RecJ-like protein
MFIDASEFPLPYEYRFLPLNGLVSEPPEDLHQRTIVFLDCGNLERNPAEALRRPEAHTLNIDHHHDNTRFGTVNHVDADASCTAEIIWDLLHALGLRLTPTIAEALYVGLITDTGCFMYGNTSPRAHVMAAELIEAGVDVREVYRQVFEEVPFAKLALLARGLAKIERYDDGRLTITSLSAEDFADSQALESYSEGVIDHLRAIEGTMVAALVRDRLAVPGASNSENGARARKVSLRASDTRIDVSAIARAQGGGGHRAAAGFSTEMSWEELVEFLRAELDAQLGE